MRKVSNDNHYVRPIIGESTKSFINAMPIGDVLLLNKSKLSRICTKFVMAHLGHNDQDGILLFGTNACGKSTIMKAIGLNIVTAQAGFFVSADEFIFQPYTQIFTNIE